MTLHFVFISQPTLLANCFLPIALLCLLSAIHFPKIAYAQGCGGGCCGGCCCTPRPCCCLPPCPPSPVCCCTPQCPPLPPCCCIPPCPPPTPPCCCCPPPRPCCSGCCSPPCSSSSCSLSSSCSCCQTSSPLCTQTPCQVTAGGLVAGAGCGAGGPGPFVAPPPPLLFGGGPLQGGGYVLAIPNAPPPPPPSPAFMPSMPQYVVGSPASLNQPAPQPLPQVVLVEQSARSATSPSRLSPAGGEVGREAAPAIVVTKVPRPISTTPALVEEKAGQLQETEAAEEVAPASTPADLRGTQATSEDSSRSNKDPLPPEGAALQEKTLSTGRGDRKKSKEVNGRRRDQSMSAPPSPPNTSKGTAEEKEEAIENSVENQLLEKGLDAYPQNNEATAPTTSMKLKADREKEDAKSKGHSDEFYTDYYLTTDRVASTSSPIFDDDSASSSFPRRPPISVAGVSSRAKKLLPLPSSALRGTDIFRKRHHLLKQMKSDKLLREQHAPPPSYNDHVDKNGLEEDDMSGSSKEKKGGENSSSSKNSHCTSRRLAKVMAKSMVGDVSISKRLVKKAVELAFKGHPKFDVLCAAGKFSYSLFTQTYCETTRRNVTCVAFA